MPTISTALGRVLERFLPLAPLQLAVPAIQHRRLIERSDALLADAFADIPVSDEEITS